MDGAQVGVLEEADQIGFGGLLQRQHGARLEAQLGLAELLGDLADQALEWQLADEQVRRLLVLADLAQGDGAGAVAMRLLDASGAGAVAMRLLDASGAGRLRARDPALGLEPLHSS